MNLPLLLTQKQAAKTLAGQAQGRIVMKRLSNVVRFPKTDKPSFVKTRSRFCWHKWTAWEKYLDSHQRSACIKCGIQKERYIR